MQRAGRPCRDDRLTGWHAAERYDRWPAHIRDHDRRRRQPSDFVSRENGLSLRGAEDVSILRLDLDVPTAANCLAFDLVFGSEEYPEWVGS